MSMEWKELSPEEEELMIEKIAKKIVELQLEFPATFLLGALNPVAYFAGQLGRVYLEPMGFFLQGIPTEYIYIFEKSENVKKLMKTIEELTDERDNKRKIEKKEKKIEKGEKKSIFQRLLEILKGS